MSNRACITDKLKIMLLRQRTRGIDRSTYFSSFLIHVNFKLGEYIRLSTPHQLTVSTSTQRHQLSLLPNSILVVTETIVYIHMRVKSF